MLNINHTLEMVRELYKQTTEHGVPKELYDINTYGIQYGYNAVLSGRGGGKSTSMQILNLQAYHDTGSQMLIVRACKSEITRAMVQGYFNSILNVMFEDGRNVIQHIFNDEYDTILYYNTEHCYRLAKYEEDYDDVRKNREPFCFVTCYEKSNDMCSNFNYPNLDIIFLEELCDNRITPLAFMDTMHIISTVFRQKLESVVIMCGNISRGNPDILLKMGVYEKIRTAQLPYFIHTTPMGTRVAVTLFNALPEHDTKKHKFNQMYFGFDIDGMDVIRGMSNPTELYRELPKDDDSQTITSTNYYINALGRYYTVKLVTSTKWQPLYYIKQTTEPVHDSRTITISDDEYTAYTTPYTYYNIGQSFKEVVKFLYAYRRNDICYEDYMCKVAIDSIMSLHNLPKGF